MKSELCRKIGCRYFGKFSGKAACYFEYKKQFIKHIEKCPATLKNQE